VAIAPHCQLKEAQTMPHPTKVCKCCLMAIDMLLQMNLVTKLHCYILFTFKVINEGFFVKLF